MTRDCPTDLNMKLHFHSADEIEMKVLKVLINQQSEVE